MAKPKFSLAHEDEEMRSLIRKTDQKILARWAIECAERVMPYFDKEYKKDQRPRRALDNLGQWIETGIFSMQVIRKASLDAHDAARDVGEDSPARSAAHAAGQAVATAHVPAHAYGPAIYAQQAVFRASEPSRAESAAKMEREWQYDRLVELRKRYMGDGAISEGVIGEIKERAKTYFVGASGCHDWSHVERVYALAMRIGRAERADMSIVRTAVYLHDIGRREEMRSKGKVDHAGKGVELAAKILAKYPLEEEVKANVLHSILAHRFRNDHKPATIEAKVLFDADKLDSIGAVGVGRDFLFVGTLEGGRMYTGIEKRRLGEIKDHVYTADDSALMEYYFKLRKVKGMISTRTGKAIARERHAFMVEFFRRFEKEIRGEL